MQFREGERKGWIARDFMKYGKEVKFMVEAGGRAELTHKPSCHKDF